MTPIYNQYLRPRIQGTYSSVVGFVASQNSFITKELYWVDFKKDSLFNSGFYLNNNELNGIYFNYLKTKEVSYKEIRQISRVIKYFCYVKIIEDHQNPQLEGQIMIFTFGRKISDMIKYGISKTFKINISITNGFPNYDGSHFTDIDSSLVDNTLNIESEINYKTINFKAAERRKKLKNLKSEIELKDLRYKEYLKLKKEFENEN